MPTLFSHLCSKHKRKGHKGHRQSSSMENSHGALRLSQSQYQFPDQNHRKPTQETVSHNRTRNVSSKKKESNQISAACYTLPPLNPQSMFIFPTQEPCNQAFCSKPTKNKHTKNSPTTLTQSC